MKTSFIVSFTLVAALMLNSCNGKKGDQTEEASEEPKSSIDALQELADKAKDLGNREAVDPIDFRKLKEFLPMKTGGLDRTEATGEKSGAMGFTVSTAEGKYKGSDNASIDIDIIDTGGIAGVSTMTLAAWSMAEIDKETTTGYEKTTKIEGFKAFEKYDNEQKSGELNVLVAERYLINVEGNNVSIEQLKDCLKDIDLDKLSDLK